MTTGRINQIATVSWQTGRREGGRCRATTDGERRPTRWTAASRLAARTGRTLRRLCRADGPQTNDRSLDARRTLARC